MKLAWLCRKYVEDSEWAIKFEKPEEWEFEVIIPIVYCEISDKKAGDIK